MKYEPHPYQEYATKWMIEHSKTLVVMEMGLGKTISTLKALDYLMFDTMEINKVLVIAPKRVADMTWSEEMSKWDFTKNMILSKILGTPKEREIAMYKHADIFCINRENVEWLVKLQIQKKEWPFDCIVIDESSSFKNSQSKRFKALKKVVGLTRRVILLTGTPNPNGYMDLWSQLYLVDKGERLESSITKYRNTYFNPSKMNRGIVYSYALKPGAEEIINSKISDVCMSLQAQDHLIMPERVDNFIKIDMPKHIKSIYDELEKEYILTLDEDTITAASAGAVANKLLQMANGAVYDNDRKIVEIHDLKLQALEEIVEANEGKSIMVFYNYQHDLIRLKERFNFLNPRTLDDVNDKEDWDRGRIRLLLAHPASMGHGLNLQAGGNIIVWFGLTWSLELYQQANARLYRQGQKHTVIINHIVIKGTEDENVVNRLQSKHATQAELIDSIKAKIRSCKKKK